MKKKLGTLLEEELIESARGYAADRGIPMNEVLERALTQFLETEASAGLLTLKEVLAAKPGSVSNDWQGAGAGDMSDEDFD